MRVLKKLLCVGFIVASLVVSFSLSASAIDPSDIVFDGVSADGVVHFDVDISDYQPFCYAVGFHIQQTDKWYLAVYKVGQFVSGVSPDNFDFSIGMFNYDDYLCGFVNNPISSRFDVSGSGTQWYVFNQDGSTYRVGNYSGSKLGWNSIGDIMSKYAFSPVSTPVVDYIQPIFNTCYYNENFYSASLNYTTYQGYVYVGGSRYNSIPLSGFEGFYYETADGLTNFNGSEEIKNAIVGSGMIEPVFDSNGNITNYTYNVNFDLGLNDSPVPDRWGDEFPDPEGELLDQLPGIDSSDIDFINDNLSSDSLNSSAVQWWYARFSDVTSNNKFRVVMLSLLSLSVIAFTLNKRGVL